MWNHKRRIGILTLFSAIYASSLHKFKDHQNELARMAMAGSLATVITDVSFHFVDTVNSRLKVHAKYKNTFHLLKKIVMEEGIYGVTKGISV